MKPVVRIAETHEQDAARKLGKSRENLDFQIKRLEELEMYRREYNNRLMDTKRLDAVKLQEFQAFISKLDEAIRQQKQIVEEAGKHCDVSRGEWIDKRTRTQALNKVVERYQTAEAKEVQRREQKELDEHAGRARHSDDK
jgi:flagellar FliJ protein